MRKNDFFIICREADVSTAKSSITSSGTLFYAKIWFRPIVARKTGHLYPVTVFLATRPISHLASFSFGQILPRLGEYHPTVGKMPTF